MSALAMLLTAASLVPGNGPEADLGEIAEPQRLDLSGEWDAYWQDLRGVTPVEDVPCPIADITDNGVYLILTPAGNIESMGRD